MSKRILFIIVSGVLMVLGMGWLVYEMSDWLSRLIIHASPDIYLTRREVTWAFVFVQLFCLIMMYVVVFKLDKKQGWHLRDHIVAILKFGKDDYFLFKEIFGFWPINCGNKELSLIHGVLLSYARSLVFMDQDLKLEKVKIFFANAMRLARQYFKPYSLEAKCVLVENVLIKQVYDARQYKLCVFAMEYWKNRIGLPDFNPWKGCEMRDEGIFVYGCFPSTEYRFLSIDSCIAFYYEALRVRALNFIVQALEAELQVRKAELQALEAKLQAPEAELQALEAKLQALEAELQVDDNVKVGMIKANSLNQLATDLESACDLFIEEIQKRGLVDDYFLDMITSCNSEFLSLNGDNKLLIISLQ